MKLPLELNAELLDAQYKLWKTDPERLSREWQVFFDGFELGFSPEETRKTGGDAEEVQLQCRVMELVQAYRSLGHLLACVDPLSPCPIEHPLLELSAFGLTPEDLDKPFDLPVAGSEGARTIGEVLRDLRQTYSRSIGVEYMHIQEPSEIDWLRDRMETSRTKPTREEKLRILGRIIQSTRFEQFLHGRYLGQKRFSSEGAESMIALLDTIIQHSAAGGCHEAIIGMPHRGRLSVLSNVLNKPYSTIFCEFEDNFEPESLVGSGDVKYHIGHFAVLDTSSGSKITVLVSSNPSHLEAVDPVVEGIARARQDRLGIEGRSAVLPILFHGDAAFAGQGVVAETLNLSQLDGYRTGGTIHVVVNNQIGFTTLPEDARSTRYPTDMARMLLVPVFHVQGDDPEAAAFAARIAVDYRKRFGRDVVIDIVCYRRYGHNEGDEPYYTQPQMYERIRNRPTLEQVYSEKLLSEGVLDGATLDGIKEKINQCLELEYGHAHGKTCTAEKTSFYPDERAEGGEFSHEPFETGMREDRLLSIARSLNTMPDGFSLNPKLKRILDRRLEAVEQGEGIDWANAESLAFASLLVGGYPVRLSGQDSRRGTFSQRHSVVVDTKTGEHYSPLNHLGAEQAHYEVYDSLLSEYAVLGFEFGYSVASPHSLVLWEAQFGDFVNNAQVIVDQFIASSEAKWGWVSGLVLLLPHGYEGQGPEHTSARLERFLQLCADDNMQVCYPTTPAQYFHLLRRQMLRPLSKPLVVMTPKSLLRNPEAVSTRSDLAVGRFHEVFEDPHSPATPRRVVLCTGKIFYDLVGARTRLDKSDTAVIRIEQLYPFPEDHLREIADRYAGVREWCWAQEESENMGAWQFVGSRIRELIRADIRYVGRPASASPATGHLATHRLEQTAIVERALG